MIVDEVQVRLNTLSIEPEPPNVLAGRVKSAADLSELVKTNSLPQSRPAAFVLPLGLRGGGAEAVTGLYRQAVDETVGIVLVLDAPGDAAGGRALPTIQSLRDFVINRICGWAPDDETGVFRLVRGDLVSLKGGIAIYQINFAISDQLRIVG